MDYKALIMLIWRAGLLDKCKIEFHPMGNYVIENKGMELESAVADISGVAIRNTHTGEILRGSAKVDHRSSDWRNQGSVGDPNLDNIILHIVNQRDTQIITPNGEMISCVVTIPQRIENFCYALKNNCKQMFARMEGVEQEEIISGLLSDRIERKKYEAHKIIYNPRNNWYENRYQFFMQGMGSPSKNKEAFQRLAQDFTYSRIINNPHKPEYLEAVVLGMMGLLEVKNPDVYTQRLQVEFEKLCKTEKITHMVLALKKYGFRANSAPAVSVIRAMYTVLGNVDLFEELIEAKTLDRVRELLTTLIPNHYWHTHSAPSVGMSRGKNTVMSRERVELLIINFVVPMLLVEGEVQMRDDLYHRAIGFLEELPAEPFSFVREWRQAGWSAQSAYQSQALVQLKDYHCKCFGCVECPVGAKLVYGYCRDGEGCVDHKRIQLNSGELNADGGA